jgi:MFS family permease
VPVSVIYVVLSTLDRNNLSEIFDPRTSPWLIRHQLGNARVFGFDEDIGLKGGQFGNIQTLSSINTIIFEVPWEVLAVRHWGAKNAIGTAFVLWSALTLGTAFIQNCAQAIVLRMLLNVAEAGPALGFAFLFSTIYPRELAAKRITTTNLAQCISSAFGGLIAYAIQTIGERNGLAAWRWLFIVEFLITNVICGAGLFFLPGEIEEA